MKEISKNLMLCAILLAVVGIYYAVAFIFVAINMLTKEFSFAMEHGSIGVYSHILFISLVHILSAFLFIYSAIGISRLKKSARKLSIFITGLNLFTILAHTSGWFMFSTKIIMFIISLSVFVLLLKKEVREEF